MAVRIGIWILLLFPLLGVAQPTKCPKLPEHYKWNTARDYKREEDLVLRTLQWLSITPLSSEFETRSKANLFVMEWICGSPRIKLIIQSENLPFIEAYPDLLFPFIHGMAQYKLTKNADINELQPLIAGFKTVAFMIQSDEKLKKEKSLQPILKAYKKEKMQAYVESVLSKSRQK